MKYSDINRFSTSTWSNNSALASVGHIIQEIIGTTEDLGKIEKYDSYQELLDIFREQFKSPKLKWQDLYHLLVTVYANPFDQNVIWSANLRLFLKKVFFKNQKYKECLYKQFKSMLTSIIKGESAQALMQKHPHLMISNKSFIEKLLHYSAVANQEKTATLKEITRDAYLKVYWDKFGYYLYCQYLVSGTGHFMPMLNANELNEVCRYLKLELTVYGAKADGTINFQRAATRGFAWRRKDSLGHLVVAHSGAHAERLSEDLEQVKLHNELTKICEPILPASVEFLLDISEMKETVSKEIKKYLYPSAQQQKLNQDFSIQLKQGNLENALAFLDDGADIFMFDKSLHNQTVGHRLLCNLYFEKKLKEMVYLGYYDFRCRNYFYNKYIENKNHDGMQWFNYYLSEFHKNVQGTNRGGARLKNTTRSTTRRNVRREGEALSHEQAMAQTILPLHKIGQESTFHKAIRNSKGDLPAGMLKQLIDQSKLDIKNSFGITPMHLLVGYAKKKNIDSLFQKYGDKEDAGLLNYLTQIKRVLFLNIDCKDMNGMTPLHYACIYNNSDMLLNLYCMGADIRAKDNNGNLPIHYAVKSKSYACADVLIQLDNADKLTRYSGSSFNVENNVGQTPALIARRDEDNLMLLILLNAGIADCLSKEEAFALAIMAIQQDYITALEALIIKFPEICKMSEDDGCSLLYYAVEALNYRMCHMLLHPLKKEERMALCQDIYKYKDGSFQKTFTLIDLIQEKIDFVKAQQKPKTKVQQGLSRLKNVVMPSVTKPQESELQLQRYRKLKRLLMQYSPEAYQKLSLSKKAKLSYKWSQDVQGELESTQPYQIVNMAITYGKPFMAGVGALIRTGQPWYAFEAAAEHFLGTDLINIGEKLTGIYANQTSAIGITASFAHDVFGWVNCYRNTTSRATIWTIKKAASTFLYSSYAPKLGNSYLTYLDCASVVYGLTEGWATHQIAPNLSEYWQGIESSLVSKYNIPTVNDIVHKTAVQINDAIEKTISINLSQEMKNFYYWVRYEIGGIPYPVSIHPFLLREPRFRRFEVNFHDGIYIISESKSIISIVMHESVSKSDPTDFVAKTMAKYTLEAYKRIMPNHSEETYLAMYNMFYAKYLEAQESKHVKHHESKLRTTFNSLLNDAKLEAATNIVQHSYNTTNNLDGFVSVYSDEIMNIIQVPSEYEGVVMLGFKALAGRYYGEPNKLLDKTNDLINALITPNKKTSETLNALDSVAIVLEESNLMNYGNYIAYNLVMLGISAGTIEKDDFDAKYFYFSEEINRIRSNTNSKKYDASIKLSTLFDSIFKKTETTTNTLETAGTQASSIVSKAKEKNGDKIRKGPIEIHATQVLKDTNPEYFEEDSIEKTYALHQFLRTKETAKLTHRVELVLTLNGVEKFIDAFNNAEPLTGNTRAILSQFKPMDIMAVYAVVELAKQLDASPYYENMSRLEQFDLMEKISSYTHLSSIENEMFKMVKVKNLTGPEYHNFENGMAPAQFCLEVPQSAKQFSTNVWVGTSALYERDYKEGNKQKHLSGKLKKGASKTSELTGGIQISAGTDGVISVGTQKGFMIPINTPKQKTTTTKNAGIETNTSHSSSSQKEYVNIDALTQSLPDVYRHPFGFVPVPDETALLQFSEFMQVYDEMHPTPPALQPMNYIAYCPKPNSAVPKPNAGKLDLSTMTPYMPSYSTYDSGYREFYNRDFVEYLVGIWDQKKVPQDSNWEESVKLPDWEKQKEGFWGNTVLSFFIKDSQANSIALAAGVVVTAPISVPVSVSVVGGVATATAVAAVAAGTVFVWNRLLQEPEASLLGDNDPFPAVPNIPMILTGDYLADNPKDNIYPFPIDERLESSYITPIPEEEGYKDNIYDFPLTTPSATLLFKKNSTQDKERLFAPDPDKKYLQAPKNLPAFPDAVKKEDKKTPKQNGGGFRDRWVTKKGKILEWDSQEGHLEMYNKTGSKHLGAYDPNTGEQVKKPVPGRNIKKYL